METKLTLKLDRVVIDSAKKYAKNNSKSLSGLVEDFFRNLVSEEDYPEAYPRLIEELSGVISEDDLEEISTEDERARYILKGNR